MKGSERESFEDALIGHLPGLRRYATALVGSISAAEDLVHDCIERALRRSGSLHDRERMGAWLRSILHNLYLDEKRRDRGRGMGVDFTEMDNELALSAPAVDTALATDFMRAMSTLSADHRQILLLVGLEGLSYREVAAELKTPLGTVMSRLARARERLRAAMEDGPSGSVMLLSSARRAER